LGKRTWPNFRYHSDIFLERLRNITKNIRWQTGVATQIPNRHLQNVSHEPAWASLVDCIWNVMAHAQKPVFVYRAKWTSPFQSVGRQLSPTTGSRGVRISGSNAGYTMFRGSVKGTGYPLNSPVSSSIPLPCVTVCHHISTGVYSVPFLQRQNCVPIRHLMHLTIVMNWQVRTSLTEHVTRPATLNQQTTVPARLQELMKRRVHPHSWIPSFVPEPRVFAETVSTVNQLTGCSTTITSKHCLADQNPTSFIPCDVRMTVHL